MMRSVSTFGRSSGAATAVSRTKRSTSPVLDTGAGIGLHASSDEGLGFKVEPRAGPEWRHAVEDPLAHRAAPAFRKLQVELPKPGPTSLDRLPVLVERLEREATTLGGHRHVAKSGRGQQGAQALGIAQRRGL